MKKDYLKDGFKEFIQKEVEKSDEKVEIVKYKVRKREKDYTIYRVEYIVGKNVTEEMAKDYDNWPIEKAHLRPLCFRVDLEVAN